MTSYTERRFGADVTAAVTGYGLEDDEEVMAALRALRPGIVLLHRLRDQMLDDDLGWLLPSELLPGAVTIYGLPVFERGVVAAPMLAHRLSAPS